MKNPNGYGAIIKLSGKRRRPFAIRITVGYNERGNQKYKYIGYFSTRKDAMLGLAMYNENPYDLDNDKLTFTDIFNQWKERHFSNVGEESEKMYLRAYANCEPIHNMIFKKLNTLHYQNVIDEIKAPSTKRITKIFLQQLYKYALKYDIVTKDYANAIETSKVIPKREKIPFTMNEVKVLWKNIEIEHVDIILILLYTGLRVNELLEMKRENIHLSERYMIGGKKSKAGIDRIIPIHECIVPLLENRLKDKHLFTSEYGSPMNYNYFYRRCFIPIMKELNMDHTIHETRHSFITRINDVGVDKLTIKKIVGHSSNDITDHYTHKDINTLIEAVNKLE